MYEQVHSCCGVPPTTLSRLYSQSSLYLPVPLHTLRYELWKLESHGRLYPYTDLQ